MVTSTVKEYVKLESFISQVLDEACFTKTLWKSLGYKFTVSHRYIVYIGKGPPKDLLGRSAYPWRKFNMDQASGASFGNQQGSVETLEKHYDRSLL